MVKLGISLLVKRNSAEEWISAHLCCAPEVWWNWPLISCRRRLQLMRVRTITSKPHLTLQFSDENSNTENISQKNQYGIRPGSDTTLNRIKCWIITLSSNVTIKKCNKKFFNSRNHLVWSFWATSKGDYINWTTAMIASTFRLLVSEMLFH